MPAKPSIAIVGPGNLGSALAVALRRAGYPVPEIVSRDQAASRARARRLAKKVGAKPRVLGAALSAKVIWLCVTDDAIRPTAQALAAHQGWKGKLAFHCSGALSSAELAPLARRGARTASVHPMTSFAPGASTKLRGVCFGLEGDRAAVAAARRIARDLGGEDFRLARRSKVLYHAAGSFASPMVIAMLAMAEQVARAAGLSKELGRKALRPIIQQTLDNYLRAGTAAAFSGPLVRGNLTTVRRHLQQLRRVPGALAIYRALGTSAVRNLPVRNRAAMIALLKSK